MQQVQFIHLRDIFGFNLGFNFVSHARHIWLSSREIRSYSLRHVITTSMCVNWMYSMSTEPWICSHGYDVMLTYTTSPFPSNNRKYIQSLTGIPKEWVKKEINKGRGNECPPLLFIATLHVHVVEVIFPRSPSVGDCVQHVHCGWFDRNSRDTWHVYSSSGDADWSICRSLGCQSPLPSMST